MDIGHNKSGTASGHKIYLDSPKTRKREREKERESVCGRDKDERERVRERYLLWSEAVHDLLLPISTTKCNIPLYENFSDIKFSCGYKPQSIRYGLRPLKISS